MEQQTKKYSKATLETFSRLFYNYISDLVGDSEDKKNVDGFGIIKDFELEKQFADLNIINKEEVIKIMDALEKNITKRKTLITNLEAEVAANWEKGTTVNEVEITNCGNYYIGNFIYNGKLDKAYVVWDKNGNVAMSGMQGKIFPLDNNNFILLNSYNYLYRAEEKIYFEFYWNGNSKRRKADQNFTATKELLEKGLIIIHDGSCFAGEKKDYLYSFKTMKEISQRFDKIETEEVIDGKKIDYVKDYGCLKATCIVSSDIEDEETITNEIIGKLNLEGKLMECMFNMNTGTTYSLHESNFIDCLVANVQKELNTQVLEQKERKEQAKKAYQKIFPLNPQD